MSAVKKETSNGPFYQTSEGFRYPSHITPSKGSFLKIHTDGSISYQNPNCLKDVGPGSKPFRMAELKPRADKPGETFARLKAMIEKSAAKDPQRNLERFNNRPVFDGWAIAATDGHTALLHRGPAAGDYCNVFDKMHKASRVISSIVDPEFHLALKRAMVMCEAKTKAVRLAAIGGTLTISSEHESPGRTNNDAGSFEETMQISQHEDWWGKYDARYLEPMCGTYPLFIWYTQADEPIMFESAKGDWRYIVMPIADDWQPPAVEVPVNAEVSNDQELETVSN